MKVHSGSESILSSSFFQVCSDLRGPQFTKHVIGLARSRYYGNILLYIILANPANFVLWQNFMVKGFSGEFSVIEKIHLQNFLYGNQTNNSLIMKVIDQIMAFA